MISTSTHQPTPQELMGDFKSKKVYVPELNPAFGNVFSKRFNQEFQSIFGESK
jgi:hypothetical protein